MPVFQCVFILGLGLLTLVSTVLGDSIKEHHIPFDLNGSNFTYPWPVKLYEFKTQHGQTLEMAFMDVALTGISNNKTALLMHMPKLLRTNLVTDYVRTVLLIYIFSSFLGLLALNQHNIFIVLHPHIAYAVHDTQLPTKGSITELTVPPTPIHTLLEDEDAS